MKVIIERRDVELTGKVEDEKEKVIEQSIPEGTEIVIDEDNPKTITLVVPNAYDKYPDFVGEGWSIDAVQEFAEKYELILDIKYSESSDYPVGTIIKQSREKDSKIVNGAYLTITVTKEPAPKVEEPEPTEEEEEEESNQ